MLDGNSMYLHLLQNAPSNWDLHKQHAQAVLSLSIPNSKFSAFVPSTIYNIQNLATPPSNNNSHQEMNDGFRGRRRSREDMSQDLQQQQNQHFQGVNTHGALNDSPNDFGLLAAPLGQIDDFDGQMDGSSASPSKRIKRHDPQSGGNPSSLPSTSAHVSSTFQQQASLRQPSLPNSPFVFFFRIERENLLEKAKTGATQFQNTQQVVQTIEQKWESLPMEDRRIYEQLAAKDSERYKLEMEEHQRKQQQLQEEHHQQQQKRLQGEPTPTNNLQNMLFSGVPAGNLATSTSTGLHPQDPRMQQVNVIAGLRPPLPTAAAAVTAPSTAPNAAAMNVAPSHHHYMPPTQPPSSLGASSHAMYHHPSTITPPQNHASGIGGQPLPPHLSVHHHPSTGSSVAVPPKLTTTASGTILLPPSQSMPLPAGMEIELGGRKYRVGYQYQLMTREEAQKYVKPYTAAQSETSESHREGS